MAVWKFPGNEDGQIKGVSDAGIENFNGTEISSLARENCQNSLDAAQDEDNPNVLIEFKRYFIKGNQIPGITEYRDILKSCKDFWDGSKSDKAKRFLKEALKQSEKDGFMLRISDFNTTGLSNPYSNPDDPHGFSFEGWNALVKIDGGANKGEDKAGAYGIGKSAAFSNSYYRMVFYRTINQDQERAAQGVSRLMSYREGMITTSGVGYYGNPDGNQPVRSIPELDDINERTEQGTDVFIYGFKTTDSWELDIMEALLESFLMSIYRNHLRVKVQDKEINASTLKNYMEKIHAARPGSTKGTYGNYLALTRTEGVHIYSKEFHGMGKLELRLLVDPDEKLDHKVLVVRKAGMKLFRMGSISRLISFTGILELKGKELNSYFKEMETVAHDKWEPGRHHNPKQAKQYYEEIKDWIRNTVSALAEQSSDEEIEVEGLGDVLQMEPDFAETGNADDKREGLNNLLGNIEILERPAKIPLKGFFYGKGQDGTSVEKVTGTIGTTGAPAVRTLKGTRKRNKRETHRGKQEPGGTDIITQPRHGGEKACPLKNVRVIKKGTRVFSVNFDVPHGVEHGRVELVTVGENGKSNRLRLTDVKAETGCSAASINGDNIEASGMSSSERVKLEVTLADFHDYAMEVNVYEHN